MNYSAINITTEPTTEPITKAQLKDQLRLDGTDQDDMLDLLIQAARQGVELYLGRSLITQTLDVSYEYFYPTLYLPCGPYQSLTSIKYHDADGDEQTLDSSYYQSDLSSDIGRIKESYGKTWPTTRSGKMNAVTVKYVAGYGDDADDVPQPIRQLVTAIAVDLYEHPEMNIELRMEENKIYRYLALSYKIPVVY